MEIENHPMEIGNWEKRKKEFYQEKIKIIKKNLL